MSELTIFDLPPELLCMILARSGPKTFGPLMLTHRKFYSLIKEHSLYLFRIGKRVREFEVKSGLKAHIEQTLMLRALQQSKARWNTVRAPMGCGKTAVMIMTALNCPGRSIIIINTRIYTSWIQELKNFKMKLSQDPKKSDILLVHTKYPKHRQAVLYTASLDGCPEKKILITTSYYMKHFRHQIRLSNWVAGERVLSNSVVGGIVKTGRFIKPQGSIIVDEAHLYKQGFWNYTIARAQNVRIFLFSASPINFHRPCHYYEIKEANPKGYPILNPRHIQLTPNESLKTKLNEIITQKDFNYSHVVVFSAVALKVQRKWVKRSKKYKMIVFSNTAPTTLTRWQKAERSILLCNYQTSAEGTNFSEADCVLLFHFGCVSLEKARQTIGRIRRKNSVHNTIDLIFYSDVHALYRVRESLNKMYALNLKMSRFHKKSEDQIDRIVSMLNAEGYDFDDLTDEDILRIFSFGHENRPKIEVDKLTLPLEKILELTQM